MFEETFSQYHRLSTALAAQQDIRGAVEQSHLMMHNRCLQNQVHHLRSHAPHWLDLPSARLYSQGRHGEVIFETNYFIPF